MSLIIQELVYERPYMVLPPLIEWLRVTVGNIFFNELQIFLRNTGLLRQVVFCEARLGAVLDQDDVYQAARILLPGADFPPRSQAYSAQHTAWPEGGAAEADYLAAVSLNTAFSLLLQGRKDTIGHALQMLPHTKVSIGKHFIKVIGSLGSLSSVNGQYYISYIAAI